MMQVQNQTQQIAEEEFLLPLSEDELASIAGGFPPPMPIPPYPSPSGQDLDAIIRRIPPPRNLLDEAVGKLAVAHLVDNPKALSSYYGWGY
jgi:hypothetical protein